MSGVARNDDAAEQAAHHAHQPPQQPRRHCHLPTSAPACSRTPPVPTGSAAGITPPRRIRVEVRRRRGSGPLKEGAKQAAEDAGPGRIPRRGCVRARVAVGAQAAAVRVAAIGARGVIGRRRVRV